MKQRKAQTKPKTKETKHQDMSRTKTKHTEAQDISSGSYFPDIVPFMTTFTKKPRIFKSGQPSASKRSKSKFKPTPEPEPSSSDHSSESESSSHTLSIQSVPSEISTITA